MGKKNYKKVVITSQEESLKASRNSNGANNNYKKKNDLSDLVKVLRPKVYITDSSSFKRLVQDLTGNNGSPSTTSSISSSYYCPKIASPKAPILIDIDAAESTFEASDQTSLGQELSQMCYGEVGLVEEQQKQINGHDLDLDLDLDLFSYWDVESWLLNSTNDPYTFYDNGFDQFQSDVSIYDYEFSGML